MNDFTGYYVQELLKTYERRIHLLEIQNSALLKSLCDLKNFGYKPPAIILCKDCPNINRTLTNE